MFTGTDAIDQVPIDAVTKDGSFDPQIPWFTRENFYGPSEFATKHVRREGGTEARGRKGGSYTAAMATAWDNATVDEFGDPVSTEAPTWGAKNGLRVADETGKITELGKKLGADYNAAEWDDLLDQLSVSDVTDLIINQYYGSKAIDSIGKPALDDLDGPAQFGGYSSREIVGTGYPCAVVLASTWNPKLAYEFGKSYATDMQTVGGNGVWGFAIDLHRGGFFGRNNESPSEDPVVCGTVVVNECKGLATRGKYCFLKHFALYSYGGTNKWLSEQALREIYLEPFRMAFIDGGAMGAMTTYQGIGAEHTNTSVALITGVLRKEWQFKGAVTTDYHWKNEYCDSLIRMGGDLGMGVKLGSLSGVTYSTSSSPRLQQRLRECAKHLLYTWLHSDYLMDQYNLNPDKDETITTYTSIRAWVWWKPLLTCLDVAVFTGCALWVGLVCVDTFMKDDEETPSEVV